MEKIKLRGWKPGLTIAMAGPDYSSAQASTSLALMNTAPAELLHHLIHAALQPHSVAPLFLRNTVARRR
jgi:hypothetical protein